MEVTKIIPDYTKEDEDEDSLENKLEEDTLNEVLENLEEEIQKNIEKKSQVKLTLDRANVSLNMDHGAVIKDLEKDLEDIPVATKNEEEEKGIEYTLGKDETLKYEHTINDIEAPQKALMNPKKLIEEQIKMYSKINSEKKMEKIPISKMENIKKLNKENYKKRDYEHLV